MQKTELTPSLRLVTTKQLEELYPSILPRTTLDYYAAQDPTPIPFTQPGGKGSRRIYNLDVVEKILVGGMLPPMPDKESQKKTLPKKSIKSRGRVGTGLSAFTPKKRGPKSSAGGAS